jgi:hypothetical protein
MKYTIELEYYTGDTFSTNLTTSSLEITWENLEKAKEALERIKIHDEAYRKAESCYAKKEDQEAFKNTPGYTGEYTIKLPMDDGSEQPVYLFWQGYFDKLVGGEIIPSPDYGLSFTVN